jgi:hypothetical protein
MAAKPCEQEIGVEFVASGEVGDRGSLREALVNDPMLLVSCPRATLAPPGRNPHPSQPTSAIVPIFFKWTRSSSHSFETYSRIYRSMRGGRRRRDTDQRLSSFRVSTREHSFSPSNEFGTQNVNLKAPRMSQMMNYVVISVNG